jgi:peptide/nickel transport system permease protein
MSTPISNPQATDAPATGPAKSVSYAARFFKKPLALVALAWLLLVAVCAVFARQISSFDPLDQELLDVKQLPSALHWLGTDALGRDILSRLMHGAGPTLIGVLQAILVAAALGILIGVSAGYFRGRWDKWVTQYVNLLQAMPFIVTALAVLMVFGRSMFSAMITFGVLASSGMIRVIRSVTLGVREELYIEAARISGLSDAAIIRRHVLPRIAGPIIVQLSLFSAAAVTIQTGISFLGLGVIPPQPTWGGMIYEASASVNDFPWMLVPSGLTVALTILAFGLLGDALRDTAVETWARATTKKAAAAIVLDPHAAPIPADVVIAVRNVTIKAVHNPGQRPLVNNVSFELKAGETMGIVGESGSGKTLTALSLLGLLPPGTEAVSGEVMLKVKGVRQRIPLSDEKALRNLRGKTVGMIFQEPMAALDPCFTVGHHLTEVIRAHANVSGKEAKTQALELLKRVKILDPEDIMGRYPHQISGGMAQRVGIAKALALKPVILLADEPTTALDVTVQAEILELIRSISQSHHMAVVLVTHDWGVVADICDRAMVLYRGEMQESARVVDLFHNPQHSYTKALLRANPHNAQVGEALPTLQDAMLDAVRTEPGEVQGKPGQGRRQARPETVGESA